MNYFIEETKKEKGTRKKVGIIFRTFSFLLPCSLYFLPSRLSACPLCKEAFAKTGLARGFYWSILVMLGTSFLVVAAITGWIIRAHRQTNK